MWFILVAYVFFLGITTQPLNTSRNKKIFLVLAGIAVIAVMGLRGDTHAEVYDLRVYKNYYSLIAYTPWQDIFSVGDFEPGYAILNKLLSSVFIWDQTIIFFEAFICVFAVSRFIYKNTEHVFESMLFFITLGSMGFMLTGIRQSIAIAICILSVESIKRKRFVPFFLYMLAAVSIHRSSLVFIFALFILNLRVLKLNKWFNIPIVLGMMLFSSLVLEFGNFLSEGEISTGGALTLSFNGIVPIMIYTVAIVFQIISDNNNPNNQGTGYIATMTSIGLGLYFLRFYSMIFERIAFYYSYGHIVALSSVFDWVDKQDYKLRTVMRLIIYGLCILLFYHRLKTAEYGNYMFFWQ